jgi:hypothetical protein
MIKTAAMMGVAAMCLVGCGSDPAGGGSSSNPQATLDSQAKIEGFLEGKELVMAGDDIPSHPNGYLADQNFAQSTQCYVEVNMRLAAANFNVKSVLGTLEGAPNTGDVGTCDKTNPSTDVTFASKTYLIDNVQGDAECFDFTVSYGSFAQEGRGAITADRTHLELEIFFADQAVGMRCADGLPGSGITSLNGEPFSGDAVQVYAIGE